MRIRSGFDNRARRIRPPSTKVCRLGNACQSFVGRIAVDGNGNDDDGERGGGGIEWEGGSVDNGRRPTAILQTRGRFARNSVVLYESSSRNAASVRARTFFNVYQNRRSRMQSGKAKVHAIRFESCAPYTRRGDRIELCVSRRPNSIFARALAIISRRTLCLVLCR